jgi:hypothetical protein
VNDPYTREELLQVDPNGWPERGEQCGQCKAVVPDFAELTDAHRARIKLLVLNGQHMLARQELAAQVGCPERWAKIWVNHLGKARPRMQGPPCPYCGKPVRTSRARQCPHCFADWHD